VPRPVLYGFSLAYLFAPSTFSSANIIEFVAGLPEWVKVAEKTILAAPFAFHSLNGLRHLVWDTGKCLPSFRFICDDLTLTVENKSFRSKAHTVQATQSLVPPPLPLWRSYYCRR